MRWSIRRAEVPDAPLLSELAARTFPLACPDWMEATAVQHHVRVRLSTDAFRITLAERDTEVTLATEDGRPIGFLVLAGVDPETNLLELRQIYILASHFGTGLADALMAVARQRVQELRADGLVLGTSKENSRAIRFYRRNGFEITGERVFWVGGVPNEDWLLVWRGP